MKEITETSKVHTEVGAQEIAKVFATTTMSSLEMMNMSPENIEAHVKSILARDLAEYLIEHWNELPTTVRHAPTMSGMEHMISMVLISEEQLYKFRRESDELLPLQSSSRRPL